MITLITDVIHCFNFPYSVVFIISLSVSHLLTLSLSHSLSLPRALSLVLLCLRLLKVPFETDKTDTTEGIHSHFQNSGIL